MTGQRENLVLNYVRQYTAKHGGVSPAFTDIMSACGISSKSQVFRVIRALEAKGRIQRLRYRARSLMVVGVEPVPPKKKIRRVAYHAGNAKFWRWDDEAKKLVYWLPKK